MRAPFTVRQVLLVLMLAIAGGSSSAGGRSVSDTAYAAAEDWPYYHGSPAGTHYSELKQINTENVHRLQLAWTYDTRDPLGGNSTMESNPLVVDGKLFFVSPQGRVISLDAASGVERWSFQPEAKQLGSMGFKRGVSYWTDGKSPRILHIFGTDLYALDPNTGRVIPTFGTQGKVALNSSSSSPGAIYKDLYLIGGSASTIRAFDVRSGELRWTFHTIPRPGEFGYDTWPKEAWKTAVGANNWPGMAIDVARGIAFVSLAYPQSYYGGHRPGDNLFANSLVALDANTGKRLWHFQTIRHDVWDRDLAAPPTLVTVMREGKRVDAVAQISKAGFVYVLDRLTGESLFPLVEKPAIASDLPGEQMSKMQIEPVLPKPFVRQHLTADMLTKRTPEAAAFAAAEFAKLRSRGLWDPPSEQGTILFPGMDGGGEWGGAAFDRDSGLLFVNGIEMAWILKIKPKTSIGGTSGSAVYQDYCAACHGEDRAGHPPEFPSLIGVGDRRTFFEISKKISAGGGRMPAFPALVSDQVRLWSLVSYLQTGVDAEASKPKVEIDSAVANTEIDYILDGMPKFIDQEGYPAIAPPWGTLNAIDLNTGGYAWTIPFGEYPELAAKGMKNTGSENYGGPIVTAGGLVFIGATSFDSKFRAFDKRTGNLLWETVLPAPGNATPATYSANGRQYVVIAAGGGRPPTAKSGTKILAFALPE
jgi:quinoprotein glucose dehydrogenase